jgi:MFS family permease
VFSDFFNPITSLFAKRLTRQIRELYSATLIMDLAVSMVAIFEPVFLYVFFSRTLPLKETLECVIYFYLALYVLYFFLVPVGAKFARHFGYENSIALASLFQIMLYFSLFAMNQFPWAAAAAVVVYAIAKCLYWPAFHANFARFSADGEQGREISNLYALESFIYIIGPLVGGLILETFGFKVLFIAVSILMLASNIPMLITKEVFEPKYFPYFKTYKSFFKKENRKKFFAHWGYGEELIVLVLWPIFMYLAANDFLGLGIISAISVLVTTMILLFIGRWTDKRSKNKLLKFGVVLYFFSWLFKILTRSYLGIILLDIYSRVSKNTVAIPITAGLYQNAQHGSVMEEVVFFETALVTGKIVAMLLSLVVLQLFVPGWNSLFILGAFFTLFYLLFNYHRHEPA